jgi:anti-anti-sigma factor
MEAGPEFTVTRWRAGEAVVVAPEGEIDLATVDALQAELDIARGEAVRVVLDLRAVAFIDSAGVRLVLEANRELKAAGGDFAVVRGSTAVRRVFALVGLGGRIDMLDEPPRD